MIEIAPFDPRDYDEVMALWSETEGLTLRDVDSCEAITRYLARNPSLSFVARDQGRIVGAVLAGTDGRRGYLGAAGERAGAGVLAAIGLERAGRHHPDVACGVRCRERLTCPCGNSPQLMLNRHGGAHVTAASRYRSDGSE